MHFSTFPRTEPPPHFVPAVMETFRHFEKTIGTAFLRKGLSSDNVMSVLRDELQTLGFAVEADKSSTGKLKRPVFLERTVDHSVNMKSTGFLRSGDAAL